METEKEKQKRQRPSQQVTEFLDDDTINKLQKKTNEYMLSVKKTIRKQYNEIPAEFHCQLQILEDMYFNYLKAAEVQKNQKVIVKWDNGAESVNQNLAAMLRIAGILEKIVKNFGLSPYARGKITRPKEDVEQEEDFFDTI